MRRKHVQYTVSTVLNTKEYRELLRYVRAQDKSTSAALRELLVPMVRARVTAQEQAHGRSEKGARGHECESRDTAQQVAPASFPCAGVP